MSTDIRILVVDDEDLMLDEMRRVLDGEGYTTVGALTRADALHQLAAGRWDLVVLDQRLDGPSGPDRGLGLIDDARLMAPGARIIVVTAFASDHSIASAFDAGADDFIEKTSVFYQLLRHKARLAIEAVRDRRMLALETDAREKALADWWQTAQIETDRNRKGLALEETVKLLLQTMPGFSRVRSNVTNGQEEIDVLVANESTDAFWSRQSPYLLIECKNWSRPVGKPEFTAFLDKVKNRYGQCKLGVLIAVGGFAATVKGESLRKSEGDHLVMLLDGSDLGGLIRRPAGERVAHLKALHGRAIVEVNGRH